MTQKSSGWAIFRPMVAGVLGFMAINLAAMALIMMTPLNRELNLHYGNYLPAKLEELRQASEEPNVLFVGTSQTHNGFIPAVFDRELADHEAPEGFNFYALQNKIPPSLALPLKGGGDNRSLGKGNQTETRIHSFNHSFNMGLPNNRYDIMLGYLRMHQRKYGKPRLLLVELSPSIQEKDAATYYLPALYYRTLLEEEPSLAAACLGNPLLSDNVRKELLLSSLSSFRQFRLTFSPLNLLRKVSEKLHLPAGLQEKLSGNQAAAAVKMPRQKDAQQADAAVNASRKEDIQQADARQADRHASAESAPIPQAWLAQGWSPREKSLHMRTPEGIRQSVIEAEKYYIASQKAVSFDKLEALLHYCHEQKIPVVLVTWPNHPAYRKVFERSRLGSAYEQGLADLLAREKTPVIDLNGSNSLSLNPLSPEGPGGKRRSGIHSSTMPPAQWEGFFADPRHLTPEGAAFCSRQLARQLSGEMARLSGRVDN